MDFLQSDIWRNFQASLGRKTFSIEGEGFSASIIEHQLPIVGKYFYLPRGPVLNKEKDIKSSLEELIQLAQENQASWIRIEPETEEDLNLIARNTKLELKKATKNVQPEEILVVDLRKSEEELLKEMKPKTRYNIKLAEKKGVLVQSSQKPIDQFIRLTGIMAERNKIKAHPPEYYQRMCQTIPENSLKIFTAEYQGQVIAVNLVVFFEKTAIYLHGASDDQSRNVMAPFLLQWEQMKEAKRRGCEKYDFGGVAVQTKNSAWQGITRFKTGFSVSTPTQVFPGTFDLVLNKKKYVLYRLIQKIKRYKFFK